MNRLLLTALVCLMGTEIAFAGFRGINQSGVDKGLFSKLECSTGLTCTNSGSKFTLVAGGADLVMANAEVIDNDTDDTVSIQSNDEHTTLQILGFEAKNAIIELAADQSDDSGDSYFLKADTSNNFTLLNEATTLLTVSTGGNFTFVGDLIGDGGDPIYGFLQNQVASTTASLTIAQCGSTIVSNSADVMTLPEASTALGCRYTFVCGTADDLDVNPADGTDQIGPALNSVAGGTGAAITPSAGDAIRCTDIGSSIILEAVGADLWAPVGVGNGAWTDIN